MPEVCLVISFPIAIGPRRNAGERLGVEQPPHIASRDWREACRREQRDKTMTLRTPCAYADRAHAGHEDSRQDRCRNVSAGSAHRRWER